MSLYIESNKHLRRLWLAIEMTGRFISTQISLNVAEVVQCLSCFVFLGIYWGYSRLVLSAMAVTVFGILMFCCDDGDDGEEEGGALFFYVVFILWFIFSILWTGPEYYSKCVWREIKFGWYKYILDAAHLPLLFIHTPNRVVKSILAYMWLLNFIYPNESIVMNCVPWWNVTIKIIFMSFVWNALHFEEMYRRRCIGIIVIFAVELLPLLCIVIVGIFYYLQSEHIYVMPETAAFNAPNFFKKKRKQNFKKNSEKK